MIKFRISSNFCFNIIIQISVLYLKNSKIYSFLKEIIYNYLKWVLLKVLFCNEKLSIFVILLSNSQYFVFLSIILLFLPVNEKVKKRESWAKPMFSTFIHQKSFLLVLKMMWIAFNKIAININKFNNFNVNILAQFLSCQYAIINFPDRNNRSS